MISIVSTEYKLMTKSALDILRQMIRRNALSTKDEMVESKLRMVQNSTNLSLSFQHIKDHIQQGLVVCEVDVQRDFDRIDPLILADAIKELGLWDEMVRFWEALILQECS